jgi:RNA polymerase sigma factor (TIGR02999 family)
MPVVYQELRALAHKQLRAERANHTLSTTALVHEAYLRLYAEKKPDWENKAYFFGTAARVMRRILVDYARGKKAKRRGGQPVCVEMEELVEPGNQNFDVLHVDRALTKLASLDTRQAEIVELRYFAGMTIEETAKLLGVSASTVKQEWTMAKAWLHREIAGDRVNENET